VTHPKATGAEPEDGIISSGAILWQTFIERAGLQPETYDDELVNAVCASLGIDAAGDVPGELELQGVSAQVVLNALLGALRPFAQMMTELLAVYEFAGATAAVGDNLRISYDFDDALEGVLDFDLTSFRETAQRWSQATRSVPHTQATVAQLWDLEGALRLNRVRPVESPAGQELRSAYRESGRGHLWPLQVPPRPDTGHFELDRALDGVNELTNRVLELTREYSSGPDDLQNVAPSSEHFDGPLDPGDGELPAALTPLLHLHSDHWLAAVVDDTQALGEAQVGAEEAASIAQQIDAALAAVPTAEQTARQRMEELLKVLSLPVWGRRHALYSAWIFTLIVDAVGRDHVKIHVLDGRLEFAFSGTHLATVELVGDRIEVWAELRHSYETPIGKSRVAAVQPDYTLSVPPINRIESAAIVVEAKQYRRGQKRNFLDAMTDYAGAHPRARVLLANYGTMPKSVIDGAPTRTKPFGGVHPGNPQICEDFRQAVRDGLPRLADAPATSGAADQGAIGLASEADIRLRAFVSLQWSAGEDLDLYLRSQDDGVVAYYGTLSSSAIENRIQLWEDVRSAPGLERAEILQGPGPVEVWVNRFSGTKRLPDTGAVVRIDCRGHGRLVIPCPGSVADSPWWAVGVLDGSGHFQHSSQAGWDMPPWWT
jgi:hypothetical protein